MRSTVLLFAAVLGLGAGTAFAQDTTGGTRAPSAARPGPHSGRHAGPASGRPDAAAMSDSADGTAPPSSAYQGGAGSPFSAKASNINGRDAKGEIANRLPDPGANANTPEAMLAAAQRALDRNNTGAAQEALERAETRALTRTIDPSTQGQPDTARMVQAIAAARRALGNNDRAAARAAIQAAMAAPVPPLGPATTTTTVMPGRAY